MTVEKNETSLTMIANKIKMDPKIARAKLRKLPTKDVPKTSDPKHYVWDNKPAVVKVTALLKA